MSAKKLAECVSKSEINELHDMLKIISDVNRLKIMCLLFQGEKCVCDIEEQLGISQPLASHHLSVLREVGLVRARKSGTWCYHSLVPEAVERLNRLFLEILGTHKIDRPYPRREECEKRPART
ncbi:MAG: helix-turn-helix transcriptional regulator [Actinobacteria bacterium]|nr:helix-turn-helix transcriptional regulator [Actinomycetota bacterium]